MNTIRLYELQIEALKYLIRTFPSHKDNYRQKLENLIDPPDETKVEPFSLVQTNDVATQTINLPPKTPSSKMKKKKSQK